VTVIDGIPTLFGPTASDWLVPSLGPVHGTDFTIPWCIVGEFADDPPLHACVCLDVLLAVRGER
jgi:hypothetical protein